MSISFFIKHGVLPKHLIDAIKNNSIKHISKNLEAHQFHLVKNSPLPIWTALSVMLLVLGLVFYWHPSENVLLIIIDRMVFHLGCISLSATLLWWFITIVIESGEGHHKPIVQKGLRLGMILFIISEILFFFAFFWAFFHFSLSPSIFIGCVWPPKGIQPLDVWGLPLVNTLLLLSSGFTLTLAHRTIIKGDNFHYHEIFAKHLLVTIIFGVTFLSCQYIEYKYGITFSWKENVYGSIFFVLTGFHGFHVIIGTFFLWFCLARVLLTTVWIKPSSILSEIVNWLQPFCTFCNLKKKQKELVLYGFSSKQHLGFEAAAWYWHFVDVVWLFLFITVYCWGS